MTYADAVKAIFVADTGAGGIATLATGGLFTFEDTKRLGLSSKDTPTAWDSTGLMKPTVLVKDRDQVRDGGVLEDRLQQVSFREVVEVWFYDDGAHGYTTNDAMMARAFKLLHGKRVSSSLMRWQSNILRRRDEALAYASMQRSDYEIRGLQS